MPRSVYIVSAWLIAGISVALAARYGFKSADTPTDGIIYAVLFGAIAAGGGVMQALAVHVVVTAGMARGWRVLWGLVIGAIGLAAMLATVLSSLGAIAGRADAMAAERTKASDSVKDDRADLARLTTERKALTFTPADADAVAAAKKAAMTAERARLAECGDGSDPKQRGKNCRAKEDDEKTANEKLTTAATNKALTDRAAKLDTDLATLRTRLEKAPTVQTINPLAAALARLTGMSVSDAADKRDLFLAIVLELLVAGSMIGVELSRGHQPPVPAAPATPPPLPAGDIGKFLLANTVRKLRSRISWREMHVKYTTWCADAYQPLAFEAFASMLATICRDVGVKVTGRGADAACVDIALKA